MAQPAVQETQTWSLGWKEPLGKEMATKSSILAWKIPWAENPVRLQYKGSQESDRTKQPSPGVSGGSKSELMLSINIAVTWIGKDEIFTVAFNTYPGWCFYSDCTWLESRDEWGSIFQTQHFDMIYDVSAAYLALKKMITRKRCEFCGF